MNKSSASLGEKTMKKAFLVTLTLMIGLMFLSCDNDSGSSEDPQVQLYADSGVTVYFTLGTFDQTNSTFQPIMSWLYASDSSFSDYGDISAGTYYMIFDYDSDHSKASVITSKTVTVEDDQNYLMSFFSNDTYSFAQK